MGKVLSKKIFSEFFVHCHELESRYRNEIPKAETPYACNQRRGTLPVRITLQGGWSLSVSLQYGSTNRGQKFSKSKIFGKTEK